MCSRLQVHRFNCPKILRIGHIKSFGKLVNVTKNLGRELFFRCEDQPQFSSTKGVNDRAQPVEEVQHCVPIL